MSNPLAVTRAYATQFTTLGGIIAQRRRAHAASPTAELAHRHRRGPLDAKDVVVALGPWAPDLLGPLGIKLPLAFKRGYHRHYRRRAMPG